MNEAPRIVTPTVVTRYESEVGMVLVRSEFDEGVRVTQMDLPPTEAEQKAAEKRKEEAPPHRSLHVYATGEPVPAPGYDSDGRRADPYPTTTGLRSSLLAAILELPRDPDVSEAHAIAKFLGLI